MSKRKPAYRVKEKYPCCYTCGGGGSWALHAPDATIAPCVFSDKEEAMAAARALNRAYELGRESAAKTPAKGRTE